MKSAAFKVFLFTVIQCTIWGCAKRGAPDGGPIDEEPPKYVRARPDNFTTNFDAQEIRIYFDEFIKLTDPQRQIIISPPMDPRPEITPLGTASRSIRLRISDTLQPNTTYTINFGRSITDNNEGNPLDYFTYAFSTGPYIDSLTVSGNVSDALLKMPDPFISVMLYEVDSTYTDSVVYNQPPRYVTNTLDSATTFQLKNLKEGTYQLVGIRDANNNYLFDPSTDKIAFSEEYITLPTESTFDLILFNEIPSFRFVRPQQKAGQHFIFGYEGISTADSVQIALITPQPEGFTSRITKDREKDSLHFWFKPELEADSLRFSVRMAGYQDTLLTRRKDMDRDSLQFSFEPRSTLPFDENLKILPTIPLAEVKDSLIQLVDRDTLSVPFTATYDTWNNLVLLEFEKQEEQTYRLTAFPGAFTGFFGTQNDTLTTTLRTQSYTDFGNLSVNLQNIREFPIILQLTNEKGEVQQEKYSSEETLISFENIKPGTYFLRLIYDTDEDGAWDTGSFLARRQAEEVVHFPDAIDIRANWDVTQTFTLE